MTKNRILYCKICFLLCLNIIAYSCFNSNSNTDNNNISDLKLIKEDSIKKVQEDSIAQIKKKQNDSIENLKKIEDEKKYQKIIQIAESDFFKSLKAIDKDFGENNYSKLKQILQKHKKSPYDLYIELTEIFIKSKDEAVQIAISSGLKELKYVNFIGEIKDRYINEFQQKYGIDNRLYMCFKNNYCLCYKSVNNEYCNNGEITLKNGEYWK